ncbi:MAG: transglutaminase domain-containing protein [Cellulomonadaceae bacterium]|nr:transglutaminase domain-containing protein [Cellulomonadaceae bacterium]
MARHLVPVGALIVAAAVLIPTSTFDALLAPGAWFGVCVGVVAVLAVVTAAVRSRSRSVPAPTVAGVGALVLLVGALYTSEGTGLSIPRPTPDGLSHLNGLFRSGVDAIVAGHIPVEPVRGIELLIVGGAALAFLLTDLVALGMGRGGVAGLLVAGLLAVPVSFEHPPTIPALVSCGVAYLMLLWVTRSQPPARLGAPREGLVAGVTALAVVAVALVAGPIAARAPLFATVVLPAAWGSGGVGSVRLSTDLDMRASLGDRSSRTILTYSTDDPDIGPLRTHTMVDFDGAQWHRSPAGDLTPADGVLWPTPTAGDLPVVNEIRVQVGDLDQDRLPIPTSPRSVTVDGAWRYDAAHDEVVAASPSTRATTYVVEVRARDLTPEALRADAPPQLDPSVPELAVPDSPFADEIRAQALDITDAATSVYDKALALQTWFRDTSRFTYDTRIPPAQTEDAVWDFLTQRSGYCVQYATTMAVMARMLGIPARVAVGFLPGSAATGSVGTYEVSGQQAHAWPELWFAGAGWVRFEPTPAVQTGPPPTYADPFAAGPETPAETIPTGSAQSAVPSAAPTSGQAAPGRTTTTESDLVSWPRAMGGGLLGLVLLAFAGLVWRRRGRTVPDVGPEASWARLRVSMAERGVRWPDSSTPRQVARTIRAAYPTPGPDREAESALGRLVDVVEAERYQLSPQPWDAQELAAWVRAVEEPLDAELSRSGRDVVPSAPRGG